MISFSSLQASLNFYNDISLFPTTTDSVNWANAGAVFDQLNNPFTISSQLGNLLTVSKPLDSYQIIQQMSDGSGGWTGIFNEGDYLLNTNYSSYNGWFSPITINFSNPISAFITQLEPNIPWGTSTIAHLDVYDINNNLLGSNSQAAFASNQLLTDYYISPTFFGVTSTGYDIAKVVLSIDDQNTDFSINGLNINSNALATPEPSTYLFLGSTLGLLSLAMYKKRRTA